MKSFSSSQHVKPISTKAKKQTIKRQSKRTITTKATTKPKSLKNKKSITPFHHQINHNSTTISSDDSEFIPRTIHKVVQNKLLPEGVGTSVRRSIGRDPRYFSPFALLDNFFLDEYSMERELGFHPHPHRGMATFTYILPQEGNGSVRHMDHRGNHGIIGPGDVQYMAAGKGIVHSETPFDSKEVHGMQLWVNLPKKAKMNEPEYQEYLSSELPVVERDGVHAKVLMGKALGANAKIKTMTPVHYIHYRLQPDITLDHPFPSHWNSFAYVLDGAGYFGYNKDNDNREYVSDKHTIFFHPGDDAQESAQKAKASIEIDPNNCTIPSNRGVRVTAGPEGIDFILVAGEPLDSSEGVVQHGPMVMNTREEIQKAFEDFHTDQNGFEGASKFINSWVYPKSQEH